VPPVTKQILAVIALVGALGSSCWPLVGTVEGAPLDSRLEWAGQGTLIWWHFPICGAESVQEQPLGRGLGRVRVLRPEVGAPTSNFLGANLGSVTAVTLRRQAGHAWLRVTMLGGGMLCDGSTLTRDERAASTLWEIEAWRRLPGLERRFHAWTPRTSMPTLPIKARLSGTCTESWVNPRYDAHRCFAGRYVLDSCIGAPDGTDRVLCASSPWAKSALLVRVRDFDSAGDPGRGPWSIGTANGKHCTFLSGAGAPTRGSRRMNYGCWRSNAFGAAGYLWGHPIRRDDGPQILYSTTATAPLRWVRIRTIWN
jgi:hypothetical protein